MMNESTFVCPGVVPVLVGPLQVILTVLPGILLAMLGAIAGFLIRLLSPGGITHALKLIWRQKIAVSILGLILAGGIYGYRTFLAGASAFEGADAEKGHDWSTARFDLSRTGAA